MTATEAPAAVRTRDAGLSYGDRVLWQGLDLDIAPGQFVAILGSNGSGKTSLLKVLLGEQQLTSGQAWIGGAPVSRGSTAVGYVPQKVSIDEGTMLKARDLVRMGLDGHRWGFGLGSRAVPTGNPDRHRHAAGLGRRGGVRRRAGVHAVRRGTAAGPGGRGAGVEPVDPAV